MKLLILCYFQRYMIIPYLLPHLLLQRSQFRPPRNFSRAARSSLASENSPSSIPSPTYQWTKALLAYIRSNLWSSLAQASAMAVVLLSIQTALLKASRTPVDKLNAPLGLDGGNGSVHILGNDVPPVEEAACHVFAMARIALDHLVSGLEASVGDLGDGELLVVGLLGRDDWCIGDQGEVDPGVGHQVGLELSQIHVQGSIESQGGRD